MYSPIPSDPDYKRREWLVLYLILEKYEYWVVGDWPSIKIHWAYIFLISTLYVLEQQWIDE